MEEGCRRSTLECGMNLGLVASTNRFIDCSRISFRGMPASRMRASSACGFAERGPRLKPAAGRSLSDKPAVLAAAGAPGGWAKQAPAAKLIKVAAAKIRRASAPRATVFLSVPCALICRPFRPSELEQTVRQPHIGAKIAEVGNRKQGAAPEYVPFRRHIRLRVDNDAIGESRRLATAGGDIHHVGELPGLTRRHRSFRHLDGAAAVDFSVY